MLLIPYMHVIMYDYSYILTLSRITLLCMFSLYYKTYYCVYYVIGGPYVGDQAGLSRGPLIQIVFIVTLYTLFVRIE